MRCRNCDKPHTYKNTMDGFICTRREECYLEDEERRKQFSQMEIKPGYKIMFEKKRWWPVIACNKRYIICAKPYKDSFEYIICDLIDCIRGADNCYCRYNYLNEEEANRALKDLEIEDLQISFRNWVPLNITKIKTV